MRALYLTYDGLTDPLGGSQILPYILKLKQKGHDFTIISFEKSDNAKNLTDLKKSLKSDGISWVPLKYHKEPPVFATLYDIRKLRKTVKKLLREGHFDLVHCRSYITSIVGLEIKEQKGIPFVFDMRGFWADERIDGGLWDMKNPVFKSVYKYFKKKEKRFFSKADAVISLTEKAKNYIHDKFQIQTISVIPCCVDMDLFDPSKATSKPDHQPFTLGYLGSIGTWYMLEEMAEFFKTLKEKISDAKWLIITKDDSAALMSKLQNMGIDTGSIEIKSSIRELIPGHIAKMDAAIMFIKPVFSKMASSPTKLGEMMSMEVPVIANSGVGDVDEILVNQGVVIKNLAEEDYRKAVEMIISGEIRTENSRDQVKNKMSLNYGVEIYHKIYNQVGSNN